MTRASLRLAAALGCFAALLRYIFRSAPSGKRIWSYRRTQKDKDPSAADSYLYAGFLCCVRVCFVLLSGLFCILCMLQRKMYCRQGITIRLTKDMAFEKEYRLPPSIETSTRHSWSEAHKKWFSSPVRYVPDWLEQMNKFSIKQSAKDYKRTDAYSPKGSAKSRRFTGSTRHGQ